LTHAHAGALGIAGQVGGREHVEIQIELLRGRQEGPRRLAPEGVRGDHPQRRGGQQRDPDPVEPPLHRATSRLPMMLRRAISCRPMRQKLSGSPSRAPLRRR
jgi:hypothetical protein